MQKINEIFLNALYKGKTVCRYHMFMCPFHIPYQYQSIIILVGIHYVFNGNRYHSHRRSGVVSRSAVTTTSLPRLPTTSYVLLHTTLDDDDLTPARPGSVDEGHRDACGREKPIFIQQTGAFSQRHTTRCHAWLWTELPSLNSTVAACAATCACGGTAG